MRRSIKKAIALGLTLAMAVVSPVVPGSKNTTEKATAKTTTTKTASATTSSAVTPGYNGYFTFQMGNTWISRDPWFSTDLGLTCTKIKDTNDNLINYDFKTQYINRANKKLAANPITADINDVYINQDTTYTVSIDGIDVRGPWKDDDGNSITSNSYNMLGFSTDIPIDEQPNVKVKDVTVKIDGQKVGDTLSQIDYNDERSGVGGSVEVQGLKTIKKGGYYCFFVTDAYFKNHSVAYKNTLNSILTNRKSDNTEGDAINTKYLAKKSIEITFTISGIDYSKFTLPTIEDGLSIDQCKNVEGYRFKCVSRAKTQGGVQKSRGKVALVGLTTAALRKQTTFNVPDSVKIDGLNYNVTKVAASTFQGSKSYAGNKNVKKVILNSRITSIPAKTFKGCKKLTTVCYGSNLKSIGSNAFAGCTSMKTFVFPSKVTAVNAKAFYGCKNLKTVVLGKKTKSIGKLAFGNCKKLSYVYAYKTLNVKDTAFSGNNKNASIIVLK